MGYSAIETGNIKHYELREYLTKSGSLNYDLLKERFSYQYLSETVQNRILEKINLLISMNLFKNVDDSDILTVGLNLNKTLLEFLQCFNYNKPNPKIIYLGMTEDLMMIQDCILLHLLFLLGFDVLIFIPTGYDIFDRHMRKKLYCEHNIGDYVFDIKIGNKVKHRNLFSSLFRK